MITYHDCPQCGARKIRSTVRLCEVCETCEEYESKIAELERERDEAVRERDEALAEADKLRAEVDRLRAERRQLRARLVECLPWVGKTPYPNTASFTEMIAARDLAKDTLFELKK
jgi:septal ring factor EnvC (AmiA/AmiB activator)